MSKLPLDMKLEPLRYECGEINERNIKMLKVLNEETFPIEYSESFYTCLLQQSLDYSRFCFVADVVVGSICCRVQDFLTGQPLIIPPLLSLGEDEDDDKESLKKESLKKDSKKSIGGKSGEDNKKDSNINQKDSNSNSSIKDNNKDEDDKKDSNSECLTAGFDHGQKKTLYIMTLNILPAYRKRGLSKNLLKWLATELKSQGEGDNKDIIAGNNNNKDGKDGGILKRFKLCEFENISLHVQSSNIIALELYKNLGFKILEKIENYYKNIDGNKSAYYLEKNIKKFIQDII